MKIRAILIVLITLAMIGTMRFYNPFTSTVKDVYLTESDLKLTSCLTFGEAWANVDLSADDTLTVTLFAFGGAGMRWRAEITDETALRVIQNKYIPNSPRSLGGKGEEIWVFKSLKPGIVYINMIYGSIGSSKSKITNKLLLRVEVGTDN